MFPTALQISLVFLLHELRRLVWKSHRPRPPDWKNINIRRKTIAEGCSIAQTRTASLCLHISGSIQRTAAAGGTPQGLPILGNSCFKATVFDGVGGGWCG